jgi:RNA polymerase sigma factor
MQVSRGNELETIAQTAWRDYHSGNKEVLNDIYNSIIPFCLRVGSKTCGKYIDEFDDEASIARLAIIEAFDRYEPERGSFLLYLARVVRSRIIDHQRKEKNRPLPFSFLKDKQYTPTSFISETQVEEILDDLSRKEEIARFKALLNTYQIEFSDLVTGGPRQLRAREKALTIAWVIARDEEITAWVVKNKTLPLKQLESRYEINRKTADRYRKYIIAAVLIVIHDFTLLRTYIEPQRKGKTDGN